MQRFNIPSELYSYGFPSNKIPKGLSTKVCLKHSGKLFVNTTYYSDPVEQLKPIDLSGNITLYLDEDEGPYLVSKNDEYTLYELARAIATVYSSSEGVDDVCHVYAIKYDGESITDECNH